MLSDHPVPTKKKSRRFIALCVAIQDHWLWNKKPLCQAAAWIDLLLMANWRDKEWQCNQEIIVIKRGQTATSQVALGVKWGWSRNRVARFLKLLKNGAMVELQSKQHYSLITILNYNSYQDIKSESVQRSEHKSEHKSCTSRATVEALVVQRSEHNPTSSTIDTNVSGVQDASPLSLIKVLDYVYLSQEDIERLIKSLGEQSFKYYTKALDNYLTNNPDKRIGSQSESRYRDHAKVLDLWVERDKIKNNGSPSVDAVQSKSPFQPKYINNLYIGPVPMMRH